MANNKCTLIIEDEVNIKFQNLDPVTRRKIVTELKFFIPYARHTPAFKLGRWDGYMSLATTGGRTFFNLLDRVLPIIMDEGYELEIDDQRATLDLEFPIATLDMFSDTVWPNGHMNEGEPIILRDYQVDVINNFLRNPQSLQEIATGAGKTLITAALSKLCEPYGRTIVVVPNKDLVTQTEADYINLGLDVGVFFGDRKEWNKTHTICTWQSLSVLDKKSKNKLVLSDEELKDFLDNIQTIIVDECFSGDTLVTMVDRTTKKIKELKSGDKILSFNEETRQFEEDEVMDLYHNMVKSSKEKMFEIELDNGNNIQVTGNHKLLTERGWIQVKNLDITDVILSINDK